MISTSSKIGFGNESKKRLTKRAPDAGDSGAIPSLFLRLSIFPVGRRSAARPSAGIPYGDDGANRWLANVHMKREKSWKRNELIGLKLL